MNMKYKLKAGRKQHAENSRIWNQTLHMDIYMDVFTDCSVNYETYSIRKIKNTLAKFSVMILRAIKKEVKRRMLDAETYIQDYKKQQAISLVSMYDKTFDSMYDYTLNEVMKYTPSHYLVRKCNDTFGEVFVVALIHMRCYSEVNKKGFKYIPDKMLLPQNTLGQGFSKCVQLIDVSVERLNSVRWN